MSDDDFMLEDDEQDYDFDYEDDDDDDEPDVGLENKYYNAKARKEDDPAEALTEFQSVVDMEEEKGDWGFKALKQMAKISYRLGRREDMLKYYKQLLTYMNSIAKRDAEKSISNILDYTSTDANSKFTEQIYRVTLDTLTETKNEKLLVKTNLKLAKQWLDRKDYDKLNGILKQLRVACEKNDGKDDQSKGTHMLEVLALEIQMYTATKNTKRLKELYQQSISVKSAIPHPRIMGVIRECGGKMFMGEKQWDKAQTDFFESFKNYDEAGSPQRIQILKYLVLANMLTESQIDPFESAETKPYKNDKEIKVMTNLVGAYQKKELGEFERILIEHNTTIMSDTFIKTYIDIVLKNIRTQVLMKLIKPYTRIELQFLSTQLNISVQEVEELVVALILDEKVTGQIDQVNSILELDPRSTDALKYEALYNWSSSVSVMGKTVFEKAK